MGLTVSGLILWLILRKNAHREMKAPLVSWLPEEKTMIDNYAEVPIEPVEDKSVLAVMRIVRIWVMVSSMFGGSVAIALEWDQLSDDSRKTLAPFESRWSSMSDERQQKLQKGADRWSSMSAE